MRCTAAPSSSLATPAACFELERDYLRRFPKRTWQGSGGTTGNRQAGLVRIAATGLYEAHPPMLITEGHARVLTAAGRARLAEDDA